MYRSLLYLSLVFSLACGGESKKGGNRTPGSSDAMAGSDGAPRIDGGASDAGPTADGAVDDGALDGQILEEAVENMIGPPGGSVGFPGGATLAGARGGNLPHKYFSVPALDSQLIMLIKCYRNLFINKT